MKITEKSELFYRLERVMVVMGAAVLDTGARIDMHDEAIGLLRTIFLHLDETGEVLPLHVMALLKLADALSEKMR